MDNLGKFDSKCDFGILLGYSESYKAYRVYNTITLTVDEAIRVRFNENKLDTTMLELYTSFCRDENRKYC